MNFSPAVKIVKIHCNSCRHTKFVMLNSVKCNCYLYCIYICIHMHREWYCIPSSFGKLHTKWIGYRCYSHRIVPTLKVCRLCAPRLRFAIMVSLKSSQLYNLPTSSTIVIHHLLAIMVIHGCLKYIDI